MEREQHIGSPGQNSETIREMVYLTRSAKIVSGGGERQTCGGRLQSTCSFHCTSLEVAQDVVRYTTEETGLARVVEMTVFNIVPEPKGT